MPNFVDVEVYKGQYITKEGDEANRIYIIKDGEFQVTKKRIHKNNDHDGQIQEILDDPQKASRMNNKFFKKNTT